MVPFLDQIITGLIAFVVGGGAGQLITARREAAVREKEAAALGARTGAEVTDMSMSTLVKINQQLTIDYERVKAERDDYYSKFETLRVEVNELQDKLEQAQDDLRAAHEATAHLQKQLESLMASLPRKEDVHGTEPPVGYPG